MATEIGDQALALSEPKPTVGVYEYRFATGALAVTNAAEKAHWSPPFRLLTRNRQAFSPQAWSVMIHFIFVRAAGGGHFGHSLILNKVIQEHRVY